MTEGLIDETLYWGDLYSLRLSIPMLRRAVFIFHIQRSPPEIDSE